MSFNQQQSNIQIPSVRSQGVRGVRKHQGAAHLKRHLKLAAAVAAVVSAGQSALAATGPDTWVGSAGSGDWITNVNWVGTNKPPATGDSLVFNSTNGYSSATLVNTLTTSAFNVNGITFASGRPPIR